MSSADPDPSEPFDAFFDATLVAGVWVDATFVHRERDTFTIDFVRHVPSPAHRLLVARTILAPVVATELRDRLDETWLAYLGWSMPSDPHE